MTDITIREIPYFDRDALRQMEDVQRAAWNYPDRRLTPWELVNVLQYNGASVVGAFEGETLVGHAWAVIGTLPGLDRRDEVAAARLQMYSHQLAVRPDYRGQGIGRQLKLAQRDFANRIGVRLLTWTFDPLVSRNAWLNIVRLGGITNTFLPDFYGPDKHRCYLEWWITTNRVEKRIAGKRNALSLNALIGGGAEVVNPITFNEHDLPVPTDSFVLTDRYMALLEIPDDIDRVDAQDLGLGQAWRDHAADLLGQYLLTGFVITDFAREQDEAGRWRSFYLVTHREAGRVFESAT